VHFDGHDVTDVGAAARNIGMVFQSLALFPHMTVAQNVAFGLRMKKMPRSKIDEQVRRMLAIVRLDHLADRFPAQMSGGQQQRVALARALAIAPSVLILDEPFGALDRKLREAMQVELHALTRKLGITALFVTHDQEEALMLSDAIAVVNRGCIEQFGPPEEIYRAPKTRFVADFMGMTNFLAAEVIDFDATSVKVKVGSVVFSAPPASGVARGQGVKVAIRPEKITIVDAAQQRPDALEGRIRQITYHGNASRYIIDLLGGESLVAMQSFSSGTGISVGSRAQVRWQIEDVHLFQE
jgi:ABC-type Fe3+/spermidine/putrescine transport system ATPase subunit